MSAWSANARNEYPWFNVPVRKLGIAAQQSFQRTTYGPRLTGEHKREWSGETIGWSDADSRACAGQGSSAKYGHAAGLKLEKRMEHCRAMGA